MKNKKPDIFIGIEINEEVIPIAFFEIKIKVDNLDSIIKDINLYLNNFKQPSPFFVTIIFHHKFNQKSDGKDIENYENISKKNRIMRFNFTNWTVDEISKEPIFEGKIEGTPILMIMDEILDEILTYI